MKDGLKPPTKPEGWSSKQGSHEGCEEQESPRTQPMPAGAPYPSDELDRLAELYSLELLNTSLEERFDRITRLATRILKIPISLISLIDLDRQWFKSRQGISSSETPRSSSFCAYAILKDGPLIVPDTHCDVRFEKNPLVTNDPFIRSHAGFPIKGPHGQPLGTLCVIDRIPRQFGEEDIQALHDLACIVEREINYSLVTSESGFVGKRIQSEEYLSLLLQGHKEQLRREQDDIKRQQVCTSKIYSENLAIFDASKEGMLLLSSEGLVLALNQRFTEFFGLTEESISRPLDAIMQEISPLFEEPDSLRESFSMEAIHQGQALPRTLVQLRPTSREIEPGMAPVSMNGGEMLGWLYSFRDVTNEREIDRVRNRFISTISHEIRTPLTSIQGYVDLLLARHEIGSLDTIQQEFLTIVQRSTRQLTGVVKDLLDSARIQEGIIELRCIPLDLSGLAKEVVLSMRPQIDKKRQRLVLRLQESLPIVRGDANRIRQVLTNLLSNANKYTPDEGTITLRVYQEQNVVCIEVQDTGIGLTEEEQNMLFTRFFRARNDLTSKVEGTGLGLSISLALIKEHGGEMRVSSVFGQGSTFAFTLPVRDEPPLSLEVEGDRETAI